MPTAADDPVKKFGARVQNTGEPQSLTELNTHFPKRVVDECRGSDAGGGQRHCGDQMAFPFHSRYDLRPHFLSRCHATALEPRSPATTLPLRSRSIRTSYDGKAANGSSIASTGVGNGSVP